MRIKDTLTYVEEKLNTFQAAQTAFALVAPTPPVAPTPSVAPTPFNVYLVLFTSVSVYVASLAPAFVALALSFDPISIATLPVTMPSNHKTKSKTSNLTMLKTKAKVLLLFKLDTQRKRPLPRKKYGFVCLTIYVECVV